ncbi:hypothetical protein ACIBKY_51065 [Nonomuraea sp. NPDC050394]|uniref:hypothetical protein n=1 Tax=Nonomuraea sp. NPDC050394 TaxID=3364363 RepID=UPI0037B7E401
MTDLHRITHTHTDNPIPGGRSWIAQGDLGAVQLSLHRMDPDPGLDSFPGGWQPTILGIHAPHSRDDADHHDPACAYVTGGCYFNGDGELAYGLLQEWARAGYDDDVIWRAIELIYCEVFLDRLGA